MTRASVAPPLGTERLLLRAHRADDFDDSAGMWADPTVVRHIGGRPQSREEVWTRLLRYAGLWPLLGYGYWIVHDRQTGRFLGEIGFADYKRDIEPGLGAVPECGWAFVSWAHGRGYAGEALTAVLAWADQRLDGDRTVCIIDPANSASIRLAARFAYKEFARGDYRGTRPLLFERLRPEATPGR